MSRKLASIKTISEIHPIPEKDRIELAIVDGWQVIVQKGEYQIGDKTIFVEIDSILPEKPEFEFLRSKKFRIKTMKMRGTLSQGICFPLSILPDLKGEKYEVEDDVTDILGVKKFEADEDNIVTNESKSQKYSHSIFKFLFKSALIRKLLLPKKQNKGFPDFISKTDETRIQNMPFILQNKDIKYVEREKIDGQSGTFFLRRMKKTWPWQKQCFDFGVCSRNMRLWNETSKSYWKVAIKYNIKSVLEDLIGDNEFVAIQGECIDTNVQGNKYKVTEADIYAFNLIYPSGKIPCLQGEEILKKYGIKWCPLVNAEFVLPDTVNDLLDHVTGKSQLGDNLREGSVFRCYEKNLSFKAVSPDFLIKYE